MDMWPRRLKYVSESGKIYDAMYEGPPPSGSPEANISHGLPVISLSFRDVRDKLVRKERVCCRNESMTRQVYYWEER